MILMIALLCFGVIYLLQGFIYIKYWDKNLEADLKFQSLDCVEGEKNLLKEVITNAKHLPLPILHVKFRTSRTFLFDNEENSAVSDYYYRNDIFAIKGQQIVTRHLTFLCSKRGCYTINDINMVSTDLFLNRILCKQIANDNLLYVYPKKMDMSQFDIPYQSITGQYISKSRLLEDPFEFRGIRNYQPFDNMRSINWKSSARNNNLLVNTYYPTASRDVKILLNLEKHRMITDDQIIEVAIRIASTLSHRFINDQIPLSVDTNAFDLFTNTRISMGAGSGNGHIVAINRSLARIDLSKKASSFLTLLEDTFSSDQGNHTYYIIVSNSRKPDLITFYTNLKANQVPCCYIIPKFRSTETVDLTQKDMFTWEVDINE